MKRIITLVACMASLAMTASAVSTEKCLLQHQGACKIFDGDAIETAIKNAVEGDTIFLTEGSFSGFTISKKITVRGAGQNTRISSDIKISIAGTPTLSQTVLEGVNVSGSVYLSSAMNGVKIKQCRMKYLRTEANNNDVIIDRCYVSDNLSPSDYIKGMTILNSWIQYEASRTVSKKSNLNFVNCYVKAYYIDYCSGTFVNCIVYGNSGGRYKYCDFVYSLLCGSCRLNYIDKTTSTVQNCYEDSDYTSFDVNTLENLGYIGNNGTIVGEYGGVNPYTLELAVPKVAESNILLDAEKKVLNVSLKVSAN